jgi:hypothetical protein
MNAPAPAALEAQRRAVALARTARLPPARGRVGELAAAVTAAMRSRGLPSPTVATRAAVGWSAVGVFALFFQVQARVSTSSGPCALRKRVPRRHALCVRALRCAD